MRKLPIALVLSFWVVEVLGDFFAGSQLFSDHLSSQRVRTRDPVDDDLPWITQYWENDFAKVIDYASGEDGQYSLDWDNGFGGNFVIGKGHRPGGPM
jgi:hypothetical protein